MPFTLREDLDFVQGSIDYNFKNLQLLLQAFTRKSYSNEHPEVQNNEVLEFYGDEILDFFVTKQMYKRFSKVLNNQFISDKNEGELTKFKSIIVSKESLARCMLNSGFSNFMFLGESDIKNEAQKSLSVNEDLFEAIIGAVAVDSEWNYNELEKVCKTMIEMETMNNWLTVLIQEKSISLGFENLCYHPMHWQIKNVDDIQPHNFYNIRLGLNSTYTTPKNPKTGLCEYWISFGTNEEHRFKGIGNGIAQAKLDAEKQTYQFLCYEEIRRKFKNLDYENPASSLNELFQKKVILEVRYEFHEHHDENGNPIWNCKAFLEGYGNFESENISKKYAKQDAASKLLKYIVLSKKGTSEIREIPIFKSGSLRNSNETESF